MCHYANCAKDLSTTRLSTIESNKQYKKLVFRCASTKPQIIRYTTGQVTKPITEKEGYIPLSFAIASKNKSADKEIMPLIVKNGFFDDDIEDFLGFMWFIFKIPFFAAIGSAVFMIAVGILWCIVGFISWLFGINKKEKKEL